MFLIINKIIKQLFGVGLSLIALLLLSPLFLIIMLAIKLDSKGNVFFLQDRRTKNGRLFKMIKFRSMVENAEQEGTKLFNFENDSRVTRVGRFLRDSSLDELPQLLNVIKGDMAIVGPRPPVSYELGDFDTLNCRYKKRFEVIAGITGLAQVVGRNGMSWDEKVNMDNRYIDLFRQYGVLIDIKILVQTFVNVFMHKNIYEEKLDQSVEDDIQAAEIANDEVIRKAHLPE